MNLAKVYPARSTLPGKFFFSARSIVVVVGGGGSGGLLVALLMNVVVMLSQVPLPTAAESRGT